MQSGQEVVFLHLDDIIPNRFQPREVFDERALKELAASIKEHGVIQPIIVRQINNKYEIIAGERRYKASALAGMTKIPAIVNNLDDKEAAKVALLENLQRKNLNPIEEARTYQKIIELDQMTQEELARTMGKSQSAVANKLRLLALPDDIQRALLKEEISERHARTLLNIKDSDDQRKMLDRIINEKMSVRMLEEEIKKINNQTEEKSGDEQMNTSIPNTQNTFNSNQSMPTLMSMASPQMTMPPMNTNMNQEKKPNLMDLPENNNNQNNLSNNQNEIVNYGNIDDDELDNENQNVLGFGGTESNASKPIDVNQIKSKTMDIGTFVNQEKKEAAALSEKNKISSDLDSLLNIAPPNQGPNSGFNPAMEAIKQSENNDINKNDYFQAPDLMSVQLPNTDSNINALIKNYGTPLAELNNQPQQEQQPVEMQNNNQNSNNISFFQNTQQNISQEPRREKSLGMALIEEQTNLPQQEQQKQYNIQQMVQRIRNVLGELERAGAKIDTDEIDFENQYQIVIKIDKNN